MGLPVIDCGVAFASTPDAVPVYTWLGDRVRSLYAVRGRNAELDRIEAGNAWAVLSNGDRALDPTFVASPYYPNVKPEKQMQLKATWLGVEYFLSTVYVDEPKQLWEGEAEGLLDIACHLSGVDALDDLSNASFASVGARAAERSDLRLGWVLDQIGWAASKRDFSVGDSSIQAYDFDNYGVKAHFDDVAAAENGTVFIDGQGRVAFHSRSRRLKPPYNSSVAIFGDAAGEFPYAKLSTRYTKRDIYNVVIGQRANAPTAPEYLEQDAASILDYRHREMPTYRPWLVTDAEVQDATKYRLSLYKDAIFRFDRITLEPQMDDALWPVVLGREIGDRITIRRRPKAGALIQQDCHIERIEHTYVVGRWTTTWTLSPASQYQYWIMGDANLSLMGQTTRLGY